jgi:membrane protein implicated in regulation of membrane protease activity
MHILIGMAVATLLIIGCFAGNLFVCVFLSLAPALGALIFFAQTPAQPGWGLVCIGVVCVIWLPRYLRLRAYNRPQLVSRLSEAERLAWVERDRATSAASMGRWRGP